MNKLIKHALTLVVLSFLSFVSNAQNGCPVNFPYVETICITNNSNMLEGGKLLTAGCDYQVCVKIKPKGSCFPECIYPSTDGYWSTYCETISVGNTFCFNIPSTSNPITDCWDVDISIKVVGHPAGMINAMSTITSSGLNGKMFGDDCSNLTGDFTVIRSITGAGDYNFGIFLRRLTGFNE